LWGGGEGLNCWRGKSCNRVTCGTNDRRGWGKEGKGKIGKGIGGGKKGVPSFLGGGRGEKGELQNVKNAGGWKRSGGQGGGTSFGNSKLEKNSWKSKKSSRSKKKKQSNPGDEDKSEKQAGRADKNLEKGEWGAGVKKKD